MRRWLAIASLTWALAPALSADTPAPMPEVNIDSVVWYYKPEQTFKRIGEYFGGGERTGRRIILRTQPGPRAGLYFVVRTDQYADDLPPGCALAVDMIRHDQKKPVTEIFALPENPSSHREFWLGFIGDDMPADGEAPVAWRVRMLDPQGKTVANYDSFLWSKPAAEADSAPRE